MVVGHRPKGGYFGFLSGGDVVVQPVEHAAKRRHFVIAEAGPQLAVEPDGRRAQALEQCLARLGQLDDVDAPVVRLAAAGEQARGLHGVEVVGQRGALDADSLGHLALIGRPLRLERDQHEPDGQRSAGLGQWVVEGAADHAGGAGEVQPDRAARQRWHGPSIPQSVVL